MCCPGGIRLVVWRMGVPSQCQGLGHVCSTRYSFLSNQTERKTLCSSAKRDRRTSGPRETSRFLPGVSKCTWDPEMMSLQFGSCTSPYPPFPFPVPLYPTHIPQRYLELLDLDVLSKFILSPLPKTSFPILPPTSTSPFPFLSQPGPHTLGSQGTLSKPPL